MSKLYFAHPINNFNTLFEQAIVKFIAHIFPNDEIENPNQPHHQEGYRVYAKREQESDTKHKGMNYFYDEVLPGCAGSVAMPFLDARLGLGVAGESGWFVKNKMPAWFIEPTREVTQEDLKTFINDPLNSDLFRVRGFNHEEVEMLLNVNKETGSSLVISHQETRLRTWIVYGQEKRPFEEAHLIKMPIPKGFYPDK